MSTLTAGEVVGRIKANLGFPWRATTYRDTFKFGGPDTVVKGIATTMFCSYDAIRRAVEAGCNMIVPHEDTYWNDRDDLTHREWRSEPTSSKSTSCASTTSSSSACTITCTRRSRTLSVLAWRGRSAWRASTRRRRSRTTSRFRRRRSAIWPPDCQKRLGDKALRVVGDPKAKVSRLQLGVGYATPSINNPDVDVVVSGEQQESDGFLDSPAYVLDAMTLGIPKGWIMLGHSVSEEQGMLEMAQWIKWFAPEVPVQLVRTGEPFWIPK